MNRVTSNLLNQSAERVRGEAQALEANSQRTNALLGDLVQHVQAIREATAWRTKSMPSSPLLSSQR